MRTIARYIVMAILVLPSLSIAAVEIPANLDLESSSSTITVTWMANTNIDGDSFDDTEGYNIDYQKTGDDDVKWTVRLAGVTENSFKIAGLESNTQYTVKLTAYSGDIESDSTSEIITTNSIDVDIAITGIDEITVSIDAAGSSVEEYSVIVGTTSGGTEIYGDLVTPVEIDKDDSLRVSGLSSGTYYIVVTTLPDNTALPVETFSFEDTHTFLSTVDDDIEGGCFIETSKPNPVALFIGIIMLALAGIMAGPWNLFKKTAPFMILLLAVFSTESLAEEVGFYKNNFGIKGGLFIPNESDQKDVYEEIVPFSVFYERMFTEYLSADIDLGYSKSDGTALSTSSGSTELPTELEMYPASASVNFNYDVAPYMTAYLGVGGDWWLVEEKSELGEFKSEVGGWHAKTGLKIFSDDLDTFKQVGFLMEASYTEIDKFGSNDIDLGGWKFNIGLMYCL